jgi:HD-GYP domain-containing protein (c-di-GMP phosphodiesterase class II)
MTENAAPPEGEARSGSGSISSIADILFAFRTDVRLEEYEVLRATGEAVEVQRDDVIGLLALPVLWKDRYRVKQELKRFQDTPLLLLCLGAEEDMAEVRNLRQRASLGCIALPVSVGAFVATLDTALDLIVAQQRAEERAQLARRYRYELGELSSIAAAISSERDINTLLGLILEKSRYVTSADAGSIYVLVPHPEKPGERLLRFEVAQNESIAVNFKASTMAVSRRSIVGAAVLQRQVINIPDLYQLEKNNPWGVVHDRSFDEQTGYRTRSLLTVPLINQRDDVIGVIQLINKKPALGVPLAKPEDFERVIPFDDRSVELCKTLASQAAISLENALLYDELQRAFVGFVSASVQAIESRDPTTSGHSRRVADLTVGLAEALDRESTGPYAEVRFTRDDLKEIEYAGLLHDFGKIGVPEPVLLKSQKLYDWERELILARFDYIRLWQQSEGLRQKLEAQRGSVHQLQAIEATQRKQEEYLNLCLETILGANQPTVLPKESSDLLKEIASKTYVDPRGETQPFLTNRELECLRIPRGSLNNSERNQIESHVQHTYRFLCTIPWGRAFQQIPRIAGDHHEKLDGSGYPAGKKAEEIPLQARMMSISDIYDALTAADRPYKRAVPCERALAILGEEVKGGKLDPVLFQLFVQAEIYRRVSPK